MKSTSYDEDSDVVVKTARRLVSSAITNAMQIIIMETRAVSCLCLHIVLLM